MKNNPEFNNLFRSFELATVYREMAHSKKSFLANLPRLIVMQLEYQFLPYYFGGVPKWRVWMRRFLSKNRVVPDYVMIGPMKSGSSDLVSHLLLHPNIMVPLAKEIDALKGKDWHAYYPRVKEKEQLERKRSGPIRCGFLEPAIHDLRLMEKLYQLNPNSKIIITLRDPVARAYSQWKWEVFLSAKSLEKRPYFQHFSIFIQRSLELFPSIAMNTVCGFPVLETGIYHKAVELWIKRFGKENVMIIDVAEYFKERQPVFKKIQEFLDLPIISIPEYDKKLNENPMKLEQPSKESKLALSEFYSPYNQRLYELLGTDFGWQ